MKKIITLLLTLVIISTLFVACGETEKKDNDKNDSSTKTEAQEEDNTKDDDEVEDSKQEDEKEDSKKDEEKEDSKKDDEKEDSKKDDDSQQSSNQSKDEAAVGDILDAPEVVFDSNLDKIYIYFTYTDDSKNEPATLELALDQVTDDTYVIYVSNGLLKLNELVYEVTDSGITKYYKDAFSENFTKETSLSQDELQNEVNSNVELFSLLTIYDSFGENVKFRKSDAVVPFAKGDVYVYDLIESGEVTGQIAIDKTTGLMVRLKDTQGNNIISVQDIKTSDFKLP